MLGIRGSLLVQQIVGLNTRKNAPGCFVIDCNKYSTKGVLVSWMIYLNGTDCCIRYALNGYNCTTTSNQRGYGICAECLVIKNYMDEVNGLIRGIFSVPLLCALLRVHARCSGHLQTKKKRLMQN